MRKTFTLSLLFLYFTAFNQQILSPNVNEIVVEKDNTGEKVRYISDSDYVRDNLNSDPNVWFEERMKKAELKRTQELLNLKDTEISSLPIYDKALLMEEYGRTKDKRIQKKIETVLLPEIFKDDTLLFDDEYEFLDNVYNTTDDKNIKAKIKNILHQKKLKKKNPVKSKKK